MKNIINLYFYFFDKKINNGIVIVLLIGTIIFIIGFIVNYNKQKDNQDNNLFLNIIKNIHENKVLEIDGKKYKLELINK